MTSEKRRGRSGEDGGYGGKRERWKGREGGRGKTEKERGEEMGEEERRQGETWVGGEM